MTPKQKQIAERRALVERMMAALGIDHDTARRLLTGRATPADVPGRAAATVRAEVERTRADVSAIRLQVSPIAPPREPRTRS